MKINCVSFGNRIENGQENGIRYSREYNDSGMLISNNEWEANSDRFLKSEHFDEHGNINESHKFSYLPDTTVERYKDKFQEYTRTITEEIRGERKYIKEVYNSRTRSANNYVRISVRDLANNIVGLFVNGKKLL